MVTRILYIVLFMLSFVKLNAQLDNIHYIPPLAVDHEWRTGSHSVRDHYLLLTTPETTPFKVFIQNGNFAPITNYTLEAGTGDPATGFNLSKATPVRIRLSTVASAADASHGIISRTEFNTINTADVIIAKSTEKRFFCNIRHISDAQGASLATKGKNALGTSFRAGFANHVSSTGTNYLNSFISVMATQNNTEVVFTNFRAGVAFFGSPATPGDSIKVVLDAGESYVIGNEADLLAGDFGALNDFNGIDVFSNKPIAMNTGSWLAGGNGGSRDIGIDQNVPVSKAGTEFVITQGNGATTIESATVVGTDFFTNIFINGNPVPVTTLVFPGDYYIVPGSDYTADQNILIESSNPVLVYQKMFGSTSEATNSMNLIPPLNECSGSGSVVLHDVEQFGGGELFMTGRLGSTIEVFENNVSTATYTPVATNITGAGGAAWRTIKHVITTADPVDVEIVSTNIINVGFFGASGVIGAAGYFSGFETPPVIQGDSSLCDTDSTFLRVQDTFGLASFNWYRNGVLIDSGGADSLLINDFGFYTVEGNYRNCIGSTELSFPFSVDQALCSSPGGVKADLVWLKADDGPLNTLLQIPEQGDQISIWFDRSNFSNDFLENDIGILVTGPFLEENFMNFNSSVGFFGNSGMKIDSSLIRGKDSASTVVSVVRMIDGSGFIFADQDEDSTSGISLKGNGQSEIDSATYLSPMGTVNTAQLYTVRRDTSTGVNITAQNFLNGDFISSSPATITSEPTFFSTLGYKYKDNLPAGVGSMMNGYISEIMLFSRRLTDPELHKVHSYLAVKWGLHLNGDYLASYGDTIWDSAANYPYIHDVAGIGKDFNASLRQKQSKSENLDAIIALGLDTVLTDNNANQGVFANDSSYLLWANNDSGVDVITTGLPAGLNSQRRIKREWKVQESYYGSDMENYDLWVNLSALSLSSFGGAGNYYIVVDSDGDGDFLTGTIREYLFQSRSGDTIYFNNFDLDDGEVFTIGASIISPGCVVENLTLWMRGDFGIDTTGTDLNSWNSLVGAITIDAIDTEPTYFDKSNNTFNYNPYIDFSGGLKRLSDSIYNIILDTGVTIFAVRVAGLAGETSLAYTNTSNQVYALNHDEGICARNGSINYNPSIIPQIVGFKYDTLSNTFFSIEDGVITADASTLPYAGLDSIGHFVVGGNSIGGDFSGQIAEIIFYERGLSNNEIEKVNSYLGIKYGITVSHNYRSSIDDILWDTDFEDINYSSEVYALGVDESVGLFKNSAYNYHANFSFSILEENLINNSFLFMGYNKKDDLYKLKSIGDIEGKVHYSFNDKNIEKIEVSISEIDTNPNIYNVINGEVTIDLKKGESVHYLRLINKTNLSKK